MVLPPWCQRLWTTISETKINLVSFRLFLSGICHNNKTSEQFTFNMARAISSPHFLRFHQPLWLDSPNCSHNQLSYSHLEEVFSFLWWVPCNPIHCRQVNSDLEHSGLGPEPLSCPFSTRWAFCFILQTLPQRETEATAYRKYALASSTDSMETARRGRAHDISSRYTPVLLRSCWTAASLHGGRS